MLYKEFNMDEALETRGEECFEKGIAIGERRGEQRGIAIGEQRGIAKGKINLAKSLLDQGFPEEAILKATGLSREELIGNK